jgi:hypothetical protein
MISTARANQTLAYEFGNVPFSPVTTYYVGLSTTPITINESGIVVGCTEPINAGYARIAVPNNSTYWLVENHSAKNIPQLSFPQLTSGPTGQAVAWFISEYADSSNPGDCAIYFGSFYELDPSTGLPVIDEETGEPIPSPKPLIPETEIIITSGGLTIRRINEL